MSEAENSFITHQKNILAKDPKSKVFAALAESYRKQGELQKALDIAKKGVAYHPQFVSGHVALGQTLLDLSEFEQAEQHFKQATQISPENILAHLGLARSSLNLRQAKEALASYKIVLLLSPDHKEAKNSVAKLESLTADEFEDELFSITPLSDQILNPYPVEPYSDDLHSELRKLTHEDKKTLKRKLSLLDAFIARTDFDRAQRVTNELKARFPGQKDIRKRQEIINSQLQDSFDDDGEQATPLQPIERSLSTLEKKQWALEQILNRLDEWKNQPKSY